jgi:hypothetical protein
LLNIKINFLDSEKQNNLEDGKIKSLPVYMEVLFEEEGKYNIVLMAPSGWGAGFFSGYVPESKKISWGIPVNVEIGEWRFIAVAMDPETDETTHETVNLYLDPKSTKRKPKEIETALEKLKTIDRPATEKIDWQILDPNFDLVTLFPVLWLKGIGPKNGELIINSDSRYIETDENNVFWEPIKLKHGSQTIVLQGRTDSVDFSQELSIYYLNTSFSKETTIKKKFTHTFEIFGSYDPDGLEKGLDKEEAGVLNWVFPPDETVTLSQNIEIKGSFNEKIENIEVNDGNEIDLSIDMSTNSFKTIIPIKIGTTEFVLKIKDENNDIVDIFSRNVNVQVDEQRIPSLHLIRPQNSFVISDNSKSLIFEGYTTPGAIVSIGKQKFQPDEFGYFEFNFFPGKIIKKDNTIALKIKSSFLLNKEHISGKYDIARDPNQEIDLFWEFSDDLKNSMQDMNIETLDQLRIADLRALIHKGHSFEDLLRLISFSNLLLISKNNLSVFTTVEAYLFSKLKIQSLEAMIQEDPNKILNLANENEEILIELADVIRWQRSLDDYLFDVQNAWI